MRYSEDHKAKTHQRIIDEAALRFRRDGIGATGLQPLMKALGLTHGGFYAHFKSKDDLVETALRHAAEELTATSEALAKDAEEPLTRFIASYLSSAHRANPGAGCPLPTMSAELGQRGEASEITDALIRDRLALIEENLPGDDAAEQSVLLLSAMVGALLLSRSVKDPELSDRLLKTTRRRLIEQAQGR
ncbi:MULTISPECIES: TetR/AcrR family transcriptional regulator [Pseudomonadaceae]|uniref:Transcriptional regulator, TetR family n=2 Tax=Ectopseudomonas TaxID=3236654 RepID=A4XRA2_ECTM1|nr:MULTISPECIES: TetR/AcrR family transcriptional regulator [Pseudomonas]ARS50327.1 TetR family transcriptional regulator [Pseudomonas mendocina]MBA4244878.1 TetR/AcrR family transcriptional regulator [Pseudomonas sp.]MBF8163817.1 TetR/AcrR family transcriptional regulator [Pseudomonas mendocina]MDH0099245.1 TetR/AcrR family transcriptional regulator [Pseudomonas sp. GD04158]USR38845.1 TetR/AcrR family transcriptional regulator [Pseudomonas hydrolytica]